MSGTIEAYPLQWPFGWPRRSSGDRVRGRFSKGERIHTAGGSTYNRQRSVTVSDGVRRVREQLRMFGILDDDIVISSNIPLRLDGLPRNEAREPDDPGVAAYWQYPDGSGRRCIAIDTYLTAADNLAAIAATLDAMRSIERHGGAEILDRAFTGFAALPAPDAARPWHVVLGVAAHEATDAVRMAYRRAASAAHPDKGGSDARMAEVNAAWSAFQVERGLA